MDFSIDFGTIGAPATSSPDAPLYAAAPGILLPLGPEECVFRLRADGSHHVMTRAAFETLHACRAFAGLDEHAANIARSVPAAGGRVDVVRRMLDQLAERRLLLSADDWLSSLGHDQPSNSAGLRAVFIDAADHPAGLGALLDDLRILESRYRGGHRYIVLDRSTSAETLRANASAIERFAAAAGVRAWHIDPPRWLALLQRAERALSGQRRAVEALLGRTERGLLRPGAARNLALLLGAGARIALLDDRQRLPLRRLGSAQAPVTFAGLPNVAVDFHPSREAALSAGEAVDTDPFSAHLAYCGQRLGHAFASGALLRPPRRELIGLQPVALSGIDARSRIRCTHLGWCGSPDHSDREWLYLLDGDARRALCRDREAYLSQLETPAAWSAPARAQLTASAALAPFVLDATRLTSPVLVGDGDYEALSTLCEHALDPQALVLCTTEAVGRIEPAAGRAPPFGTLAPGLAALLADLLPERLAGLRAEAPDARLRSIAAALGDLAAAPAAVRADLITEYLAFHRADRITRLQETFAAAVDAPVFWQADAREAVAAHGRALTAAAAPVLQGWPAGLDARGAADRLAREVESFAAGVEAWPALAELGAAQGLRLLEA